MTVTGLRPIGEIVAGLLPKFAIRYHINAAMAATTPDSAVAAFMEADGLRRQAGLTWAEALTDIDAQHRGVA